MENYHKKVYFLGVGGRVDATCIDECMYILMHVKVYILRQVIKTISSTYLAKPDFVINVKVFIGFSGCLTACLTNLPLHNSIAVPRCLERHICFSFHNR